MGDDVSGVSGDGEFDEHGIFRIAFKFEIHLDAPVILAEVLKLFDDPLNRRVCDAWLMSL